MKIKKFEYLLDRFGTDLGQWPTNAVREAQQLLDQSIGARRALEAARHVELGLQVTRPSPDAALAARIVRLAAADVAARVARPPLLERLMGFFAMPAPRVAMAIALTAFGFLIGAAVGTPDREAAAAVVAPLMVSSADDVVY